MTRFSTILLVRPANRQSFGGSIITLITRSTRVPTIVSSCFTVRTSGGTRVW